MNSQVLLINDMPGYGKVALSAMIPVLSHMEISTYNLPTAVVSNTLDYGRFHILDTTDYMAQALKVWEELGFTFDAISTGFIVGEKQADLVTRYCRQQAARGVPVFCDPIMGDEGSLYHGVDVKIVEQMKKLVSCADYIVPNYTEAVMLADMEYKENPDREELTLLIDRLREIGAKSVVVTSVKCEGVNMVSCYDAENDTYFDIPFDIIPARFPGTGDIFSAVFLGNILNGNGLKVSVENSMNTVRRMIELNLGNEDKYKGILIESCLDVIAK